MSSISHIPFALDLSGWFAIRRPGAAGQHAALNFSAQMDRREHGVRS